MDRRLHCKALLAIFSLVSFSLIGLSFGNKIHQITEARSAPCNLTSFLITDERELTLAVAPKIQQFRFSEKFAYILLVKNSSNY